MPIIDQQRRLVEVGRIRMGEKRTAQSGKQYPATLSTWRLTSSDRTRLEAAATVYGGKVTAWEDQYQLTTEVDALDIAVVPGQVLSQYFEHWGQRHPKGHKPNPVVCLLRCDGRTELRGDRPCVCVATGKDVCKRTTRLSVMLRRVPGIGMWRLDTRGEIAAGELIGGVEMLELLTATNRPVRARLRLDQRTSIDQVTLETHNFVVPVLDIDMTVDEALDTLSAVGRPTLGAAPVSPDEAVVVARGLTPVGELPAGPVGTVAEQVAGVGQEVRAQRKGSAQPIPATGRRPRSAAQIADGSTAAPSAGGVPVPGGPPTGTPPGVPGGEHDAGAIVDVDGVVPNGADSDAVSPPGASPAAIARAKHVAMRARDVGITTDEHRHAFIGLVTEGRAHSGKNLNDEDFARVHVVLHRLAAGTLRLVYGIDGAMRLDEVDTPTAGATSDDEAYWQPDRWKTFIKEHGKTQVGALRYARATAEQLGVEAPAAFAEWTDGRISAAVREWVETP